MSPPPQLAPGTGLLLADAAAALAPWLRVLTLQDHNTRVVVLGAALLGVAAGVVGAFTLLRKRALLGDALSHAMLPGVGFAFIAGHFLLPPGPKSLPLLLAGAAVSGAVGLAVVVALRRFTRLKEDAALGAVLSVFFGLGVCTLTVVQQLGSGSAAGLEGFIYGKTASMVPRDVWLIGAVAAGAIAVVALLFKELRLLCFDPAYGSTLGWPVLGLDLVLMGLLTAVAVVGLQAVGLILVIALLIVPAAAARFWVDRTAPMAALSGLLGGVSGAVGAAASAVAPRLPSGATIVLVAAGVFAFSMAFGGARGVVPRALRRRRTARRVGRQHLLRAVYEVLEAGPGGPRGGAALEDLLPKRSWSRAALGRLVRRAEAAGRVTARGGRVRLTHAGVKEAQRVVRDHRLWETYLIHHADIAPSHVDREADAIEHVLDAEMVAELERIVRGGDPGAVRVPDDPHGAPVGGAFVHAPGRSEQDRR